MHLACNILAWLLGGTPQGGVFFLGGEISSNFNLKNMNLTYKKGFFMETLAQIC
jgi:hypothetical protein